MDPVAQRRRELGDFLRKRRAQLDRSAYGLPPIGRTRTVGLRREEVAYHAGVSVTWYTWLEQGREANPSREVLEAIARSMDLSAAEREYVLTIAGYAPTSPPDPPAPARLPPHLQRLLEAFAEAPAFAIASDWRIVAWNRAYAALYPRIAAVPDRDRNLLLLVFTDPDLRARLPDWEVTAGHFLAEYRAEAGVALNRPELAALVARLQEESPEFAAAWNEHRVERFSSRDRRFVHPSVGDLVFEHIRLAPSDMVDVRLIVYLPRDAVTVGKMRELLYAEAPGDELAG